MLPLNKPLSFLISLLTLSPLTLLTFTNAVYGYRTATLVDCDLKMTSGGRTVYVGTYELDGQYYQFAFDDYCPSMINMDTY